MHQTFTQDQLIKTLYQESDAPLSRKILSALGNNQSLKQQFDSYNDIIMLLDSKEEYAPSKTSIDIIKSYSSNYTLNKGK